MSQANISNLLKLIDDSSKAIDTMLMNQTAESVEVALLKNKLAVIEVERLLKRDRESHGSATL